MTITPTGPQAPVTVPAQAQDPRPAAAPPAYSPGYGAPVPQTGFYAAAPVRSPLQWQAYARSRLDAGMTTAQLFYEMAAAGMDQRTAFGIVGEATQAMRMRAVKIMAGGGALALLGLIVTIATMAAAESSGGGMYVYWWGPVVFGSLAVFYGLYQFLRVPRLPF
jgi:hypothetical protein